MNNILSIDGGGIRGLFTAYIICHIEEELRLLTGNPNDKLVNYIDLSVGSSTGAIICSILNVKDEDGIPIYDGNDVVEMYLNESKNIFKKTFLSKIKTFFGLSRVTYDNKYLKRALMNYVGTMKVEDSYKNLMITSLDLTNSELFLFKSYGSNKGYKLWEAILASASAPSYFEPIEVIKNEESLTLTDGGMAMNNPAISSYLEIKKLQDKKDKVNLLSLGTGYVDSSSKFQYEKVRKWGKIKWIPVISNTILSAVSKTTEYQCNLLYEKEFRGNYLRVNNKLLYSSHDIDDISTCNLENLKKDAENTFQNSKNEIIKFLKKII